MRTLSLLITEELAGRKVKSLLLHRLHIPEHMISRIKLRETGICLNGLRCRTTDRVRTGDLLTAEVGDVPAETGTVPISSPEVRIVYEDEDILVMDKPAGMATHGRALRGDATAANALAAYWGTDRAFHPVTRLDRGTSGLLVVAKSGYVHELLRNRLHTDDFCREYLAVAQGQLPAEQGDIDLPVEKDGSAKNRFRTSPDGLPARTGYTVLERREGGCLVRVRLYTGRTHQIRVHFAALGCPLAGDAVYGGAPCGIGRPALHSAFLHLIQPVTGGNIDLYSAMPEDMEAVWRSMK